MSRQVTLGLKWPQHDVPTYRLRQLIVRILCHFFMTIFSHLDTTDSSSLKIQVAYFS